MVEPLRFGILGAARLAGKALLEPTRLGSEAKVWGIAASTPERARAFASEHGIPKVAPTYAHLLNDPDIDAIYNALPIGVRAEWTIRALGAGKHVLCDKPLAVNAAQAEQVVRAAGNGNRRLMEGFHYRYHPLFERVLMIITSGRLGKLKQVEGVYTAGIRDPAEVGHRLNTTGGASMDLGSYVVHWLRQITREEPVVTGTRAERSQSGTDVSMRATLAFPSGTLGVARYSYDADYITRIAVVGEAGTLVVSNPLAPHVTNELRLECDGVTNSESIDGFTTFRHQLVAFTRAVQSERELPTSGQDSIANMQVIDSIYLSAGLRPTLERLDQNEGSRSISA